MLCGSDVSMSEDFFVATRQASRRLLEFRKSLNTPFSLRSNKLLANAKCYIFNMNKDAVRERGPADNAPIADSSSPRATLSGGAFSGNNTQDNARGGVLCTIFSRVIY